MRPNKESEGGMTYQAAGVDIVRKARAIQGMNAHLQSTLRPEVLTGHSDFGGLFALAAGRYREPVLVSSADGVGTKLKLAFLSGIHDTVGIDLVAMNVDDIACAGAEPLFFLDYIGISKVDEAVLDALVRGVAAGCREAGCTLIGGETAELPDLYAPGEYDLAGFCVGVVERDLILDGRTVRPGDRLIGLAASGLHSNGYTLARKVLLRVDGGAYALEERPPELGGRTVLEELLTPTRIYVRSLLRLREQVPIKAAAHITGGSFGKNIPRVLPAGCGAELNWGAWPVPPVFGLIQKLGRVADQEMERTFNLGLGMVLVVAPAQTEAALAALAALGEQAWVVGQVTEGSGVGVRR